MPDWLRRRAETIPDHPALITAGARLTFAELDRRVDTFARGLRDLGVKPGTRVAALLGNGQPYVELVHGVARVGAVLVPLNTRLSPSELAWQLQDVQSGLVLYDEEYQEKIESAAETLPHLARFDVRRLAESDHAHLEPYRGAGIHLNSVHTIIYTSGTTGTPKGAQLTYANHWWSAIASALNLGIHGDDRWLACLPIFHVSGLSILMRSVIYGITALVHERFDPSQVNRAIDEDRVTMVSVVAAMLQRMLDERGDAPYPSYLRCILVGGGPVPKPLLEECARRGLPVVQTYGLTETASQFATLSPTDALRKIGSAGKPLLPNELRIVDDGQELGPGEAGEIIVRGPTVTPGYFRQEEATACALRDGWLHTGDLGYVDDEGFLYVLDRRDDLIISGGENVYPAEVEAALLAHPDVEEAGVVGVPDPVWGQAVAAAVVLRPDSTATADALRQFVGQRLAGYKVPSHIEFRDELPRNAAGKLLRRELRAVVLPAPRPELI